MSMLKTISLENYKCFNNGAYIDVAPLTILCGVNSSGKSSILKSLLTLKQSYECISDRNKLLLNGPYVSNGSFKDTVYGKDSNRDVKFTNEFVLTRSTVGKSRFENTAFTNLAKLYNVDRKNVEYIKFVLSTVVHQSSTKKNSDPGSMIENYIKSQDINLTVQCIDGHSLGTIISTEHVRLGDVYNLILRNIPIKIGKSIESVEKVTLRSAKCYFEGAKLVSVYAADIEPSIDIAPILNTLYTIIRYTFNAYRNIHYVAPLRLYPQRVYISNVDTDDMSFDSENAIPLLERRQNDAFNRVGFYPPSKELDGVKLKDYTNAWLDYLGFDTFDFEKHGDASVKLNVSGYNIINVGFGVSQVLPILLEGITMPISDTLLLEQPEIHLHPRAQMAMGDFLLGMAKKGKSAIVETHSDHIINRITRRIVEDSTGELRKLVKIYFVQGNHKDEPVCGTIDVDPVDGIVNAPEEFFTQFGSELMEIAKNGMKNANEGVVWQK